MLLHLLDQVHLLPWLHICDGLLLDDSWLLTHGGDANLRRALHQDLLDWHVLHLGGLHTLGNALDRDVGHLLSRLLNVVLLLVRLSRHLKHLTRLDLDRHSLYLSWLRLKDDRDALHAGLLDWMRDVLNVLDRLSLQLRLLLLVLVLVLLRLTNVCLIDLLRLHSI